MPTDRWKEEKYNLLRKTLETVNLTSTTTSLFQNAGEETVKLPCKTENDVTTFTKNQMHISEILPHVSVKLLAVEVRSEILLLTTLIFKEVFFTLCYYVDLLFVRHPS